MKTKVIDDLDPENAAMLQALYSRSASSVDDHLAKVQSLGSGKFMDNYVVGYGHKSIADCSSTTMFIEGCSLLAAKAVQDNPLFAGQETSTRYIDMSKQPIVDPIGSTRSKDVLAGWMNFYTRHQGRVEEIVRARHPRGPDEVVKMYDGAVKARVFDILRGFLPAGITTQTSWHTNLRQGGDNLTRLSMHPLPELQETAAALRTELHGRYPSSGFMQNLAAVSGTANKDDGAREAREAWDRKMWAKMTYVDIEPFVSRDAMRFEADGLHRALVPYEELLATRPKGCRLPHSMTRLGLIRATFLIDFGSYRDLQRHRYGVITMPQLDTSFGFESWYLDQLDDDLRKEAEALIDHQRFEIAMLGELNDRNRTALRQYYVGLGFRVGTELAMGLPGFAYLVEMRSAKTVHATLRRRVHEMARRFTAIVPNAPLHIDFDLDDWTVRRGAQTITAK